MLKKLTSFDDYFSEEVLKMRREDCEDAVDEVGELKRYLRFTELKLVTF